MQDINVGSMPMPATYLHPGVYIEEIPSGARPIEGVPTSIAAFIGPIRKGPAGEAVLIQKWDDYLVEYGGISSETDAVGLAVYHFYLNGGKSAYICRIAGSSPPAAAASHGVEGQNTGGDDVFTIQASSVGEWGNQVYFRIVKPNATDLTFDLEIGHLDEEGSFVADEPFNDLNMNAADGDYALTRVNRDSKLVKLVLEDAADPDAAGNDLQRGSLTGGALDTGNAALFQDGVQDGMKLSLNIDNLGPKTIVLGDAADFGFTGVNQSDGDLLAEAIRLAVVGLNPAVTAYANFTCAYTGGRFVFTSGTNSSSSSVRVFDGDGSSTDLAAFLLLNSTSNPTSVHGSANVIPIQMLGNNNKGVALEGGGDSAPSTTDYKNFFSNKLVKIRDVSILVLPGETIPSTGTGNGKIDEAIAHCEETGSRMVIIDPQPGAELKQKSTVETMKLTTSTYAVLYYPWIKVANPLFNVDTNPNAAKTLLAAPSSFAAGMWSKIDGRRGVWKAPAGVETQLLGVSGLEFVVEDGEQDQLNPLGVNCIRALPGFGSVIWGSRTLSTKAKPEWRYVPVRRTAIFIERSIYEGIQWAVFEPNDHPLWSSLRANIGAFMDGLFRAGAFQGRKASDAYFVRCGLGDTMTQDDIDRGQVIVIVGFAPLKPAEFVIVRIQQKVGQE